MKTKKIRFRNAKEIMLLLVLCIFSFNSFAQGKTKVINNEEKITIHSEILNQDRMLLISVPDNYKEANKEYPVLYVLDGNTHFKHVTAAVDYLAKQRLLPEMLVVALVNIDRGHDFTPKHSDRIPTSGGGEKFHNFITKELFHYIKKNYKASDYSILMGHSLGGMFTAYSLLEFPDAFNSYIAISPYMQMSDNYIIKEADSKLKAKYDKPKSFYMTVGDEPGYFEPLGEFSALVKKKSGEAINFSYIKMEAENHMTSPYLSLFNGLRFVFADWMLSQEVFNKGLTAIDEYYKKVSKKYGLEVKTQENTINLIGYNLLGVNHTEKAIKIFKENVKRYPKSPNVYDSLGEAYEKDKQIKLAKDNYQIAYKLGVEQLHRATLVFKKNLDRVSK